MVKQEKLKYWQGQVKDYEKSILSLKDWCVKNKTTKGSYHYWKKQLQLEEVQSTSRKSDEVKFIKVEPISTVLANQTILHVMWKDVQIEISSKEDSYLAAELIKRLQQLC